MSITNNATDSNQFNNSANAAPRIPNVVLFHDYMCGKVNNTVLSKEAVDVNKVWAPKLSDVRYEVEKMDENVDVIVIHSMTNDLKDRDADEITHTTEEIVNLSLQKSNKVVISTIISRDDDPLLDAKASAVNANIKLKYLNKQNIYICENGNLRDKKFRTDKVHLTDRGVSRLANNLKYRIAAALDITVKKKIIKLDYHNRGDNYENYPRFESERYV